MSLQQPKLPHLKTLPRRLRKTRAAPAGPQMPPLARKRPDLEFLPAALEILETPASPVNTALLWIICALATTALVWAYVGRLDVISVAKGKVQPTGRVKVIQPSEQGRVREVRIVNGQHVSAGEVLAILDSGEADAEVNDLTAQWNAYRAEADRRRAASVAVAARVLSPPPEIAWQNDVPADIRQREEHVLAAELEQLSAEVAGLLGQQKQKQLEVARFTANAAALETLIKTLEERVAMRSTLSQNGTGSKVDLLNAVESLQTQQAALGFARGQAAESAEAAEVLSLNIDTSYRNFSAQNAQKLAEAERQADDFAHKLAKASVRQRHLALVSPIEGTISALSVTTPDQVVNAGEEIMRVVPDNIGLEIEAYIPNSDIGFVRVGDEAIVKVEALPFTRYGTITAVLTRLANDAIPEADASQAEGNPTRPAIDRSIAGGERVQNLVFAATFTPGETSVIADNGPVPLTPGMAVTVEIKTGSRRILEYVFSPLAEVFSRAAKER